MAQANVIPLNSKAPFQGHEGQRQSHSDDLGQQDPDQGQDGEVYNYKIWVTRVSLIISLIITAIIGAVIILGVFADLRALYLLTASFAFILLPLLFIFSKPVLKQTFKNTLYSLMNFWTPCTTV